MMGQYRAGGRRQLYSGLVMAYSSWNVGFCGGGLFLHSRSRRSEPCGVQGLCTGIQLVCSPFAQGDVHGKQRAAGQPPGRS